MFKFIFYFSCLLLVTASFETLELSELTTDDQTADAPKINWLPVWQENTEQDLNPNLFRHHNGDLHSTESKELSEVDATEEESKSYEALEKSEHCTASKNRGLTNLIRQARPLLPTAHLRNILANAITDTEVRALRNLLRSSDFREKLTRLRSTNEHRILHEYACVNLHMNYELYIDYVRNFLNIHLDAQPTSNIPQRRPGIRGLLLDLRDALPHQQLRNLYQRLVSSDRELAKTVRRIRSSDFIQLLRNYRSRSEYLEIRAALEHAGLPLQGVFQLVSNALGWDNIDVGQETTILSV